MKYFNQLPELLYSLDDSNQEIKRIKNILTRVRMIREVMENSNIYYEYDYKDIDKPEMIAYKMYNNPERHWVFMMGNDISDVYYDLPMTNDVFDKYIIKKYGSIEEALTQIHHYEKRVTVTTNQGGYIETNVYTTSLTEQYYDEQSGELLTNPMPTLEMPILDISTLDTVTIDGVNISTTIQHVAISSYEYEVNENERKRKVRIAKPEVISSIEENYVRLVNS